MTARADLAGHAVHLQKTYDQMVDGVPKMDASLALVRRTAIALADGGYDAIPESDDRYVDGEVTLRRIRHRGSIRKAWSGEVAETVSIHQNVAMTIGDEDPAALATRFLCLPSMDERDAALVRSAMRCALSTMDVDDETAIAARATAPIRGLPLRIEHGIDEDEAPTLEPDALIAARIPSVVLAYVDRPIAGQAGTRRDMRKPVLHLSGLCAVLSGEGRQNAIEAMRTIQAFDREFDAHADRPPFCVLDAQGETS
jgi:hypothetical protein